MTDAEAAAIHRIRRFIVSQCGSDSVKREARIADLELLAEALDGRRGDSRAYGQAGGIARALALTPARRRELARNAARARWHGTPERRADATGSP